VEIDEIRGVESGGVLKTLCEKNLVRIVGKKDEPGKPLLYGTTQDFLELFQLKSLKELPTLRDYRELEEEYRKKSGEEGVITQNEPEEEVPLSELVQESTLSPLNEEEEEILLDLEENIKGVRKLEQDIFPKDKKEENPPAADDAPKGAHYGTNETQNN
jgi:segregation and condensation protein B